MVEIDTVSEMLEMNDQKHSKCLFTYTIIGSVVFILITIGLVVITVIGGLGYFDSSVEYCQISNCTQVYKLKDSKSIECRNLTLSLNKSIDSVEWYFENRVEDCVNYECPISEYDTCYYSFSKQNVYLYRPEHLVFIFMIILILGASFCSIIHITNIKHSKIHNEWTLR